MKTNNTTCGECGNYTPTGNEIGDCGILQEPVSKYRPTDDCIDLDLQETDENCNKPNFTTSKLMMINISVDLIFPHPDNPRKDLGDITELAESIKVRGIMQNLTVIPHVVPAIGPGGIVVTENAIDGYTVVIGHRRLAAAKLAGLKEVPCIISDMDYKDQIGTMLLENIQRNDLTVYEQAQGFQMMLDLGETISGISEQTGFSENDNPSEGEAD